MFEMIVISVELFCVYSHFSLQYSFLNFENHFALLRETFIEFIAKTI